MTDDSIDTMIDELVARHGDQGLSPTRDTWRRLLTEGAERPVRVVNLLRFHLEVESDGAAMPGGAAYQRYLDATTAPFLSVGARLIASHSVVDATSLGASSDWHRMVLTEYPTGRALAAMWLDPAFVAAHEHREAGVAASIATFSVVRDR